MQRIRPTASYPQDMGPHARRQLRERGRRNNTIHLALTAVTLTTVDNYWYGPNALPPVASEMTIVGFGRVTTIKAVHVGDPAPLTANAFRFFYVSGGLSGEIANGSAVPALGKLTLRNLVLQGGYAKGGDAGTGGGGAGMGGAIFNQGELRCHMFIRNCRRRPCR